MKNLMFLIVLIFLYKPLTAQEIVNGSFELINNKNVPRSWQYFNDGNHFSVNLSSEISRSGKNSIQIQSTDSSNTNGNASVVVANTFGAISDKKVNTIQVSGWIKFKKPADSAAAIFIEDLSGNTIIRTYAKPTPSSNWIKVDVTFKADSLHVWYGFYYGIEVSKNTAIWVDDIALKVNGVEIKNPDAFNYEPSPDDINRLNKNLFPLVSVAAGADNKDMSAIGNLCSGAKLVGIGEPTHGTHEAFQFKLRLLEYLVEKKGFTTLAMEEVIPTCDVLNAAINNPVASIKDSLMVLPTYKCWKTEEVEAMLQWLKNYNSHHNTKVKFIGIDMEDQRITMVRRLLSEYGQLHNQSILNETYLLNKKLDTLLQVSSKENNEQKTNVAVTELSNELSRFDTIVASQKNNINNNEEFFKLNSYLKICKQWLATRFPSPGSEDRDKFMADNLSYYIKNHPDEKILIWAHNMHIANINHSTQKSMGAYLKLIYKNDYVPICFTSSNGTYTAAQDYSQQSWNRFEFEPAYKGTYEYILEKAKAPLYFLPLRNQQLHWLAMPMQQLDKSYIYIPNENDYIFLGDDLNKLFDGIVFCKQTSASHSYLFDEKK